MNEIIRASDFLRSISYAIGVNVNNLEPNSLDGLLSEHHTELAQLVDDGSSFDVSQEEYEEFVEKYINVSNRELTKFAARTINVYAYPPNDIERMKTGIKRSVLIRAHMMKAKIEERERQKKHVH